MTLRARLFVAILVVALLSLALALAIGAVLTRRAVERNTLKDVSAQLDLLVERERDALLPFSPSTLRALRPFLERQDERVVQVRLGRLVGSAARGPPAALRRTGKLDGTLDSRAAATSTRPRLFRRKAFVLLRPASSTNSAWRPHVEELAIAAAARRCSRS